MSTSKKSMRIDIKLSPEERDFIENKMKQLGTNNLSAYIRKMAIDGYIVNVDMGCVRELCLLLRNVSGNTNQIARRVNETHNLYAEDLEDLRQGYNRIWEGISRLFTKFEKL